jgi:S1-C subfamily serine protease
MKKLMAVAIILLGVFLLACDDLLFPLFTTTSSQTTLPISRPNTLSGSITVRSEDYAAYPMFHSDSYDLAVDEYNELLVETRDKIRRANISINVTLYEEQDLFPWGPSTSIKAFSKGSGFVYMEDAVYYYAVTNFHVVDPLDMIASYEVKTMEDEENVEAILVVGNADMDLAVLRFPKGDRLNVTPINIINRAFTKYNANELVLAVGNPQSLENNVTFGVYLSLQPISHVDFPVIMHNAIIHEGSSGGALVDVDGNLLGVNTWGVEAEDTAFAIPNDVLYMFLLNEGLLPN